MDESTICDWSHDLEVFIRLLPNRVSLNLNSNLTIYSSIHYQGCVGNREGEEETQIIGNLQTVLRGEDQRYSAQEVYPQQQATSQRSDRSPQETFHTSSAKRQQCQWDCMEIDHSQV